MNDQIRKLAIKSGIDIRGHLTGSLTLDEKPSVADLEKFAELIVRECLEVSSSAANVCDNNSHVCRKIREHFGVEK